MYQVNKTSEILLQGLKIPVILHLIEIDFLTKYLVENAVNSISEPLDFQIAPDLQSTLFSTKVCVSIKENELLRKNGTSSLSAYGEAGKRMLKFPANFIEVFEVHSSNDGSNGPFYSCLPSDPAYEWQRGCR